MFAEDAFLFEEDSGQVVGRRSRLSLIDLRYTTSLEATGLANAGSLAGTDGLQNARLVAAGDPGGSLQIERIKCLDRFVMPPVGSRVVDAVGVALLSCWVESL